MCEHVLMTEGPAGEESPQAKDPQEITYELASVKEAARLLRVSESTVWRYADQDLLPAYRVGRKRVMFRRSDLEKLLSRIRRKKQTVTTNDKMRLFAMSESARDSATAIARARSLGAEILKRRGSFFADSGEMINEAREERTEDL